MSSTEIEVRQQARPPIPLYNGVMSPDRWTLFGRIAQTVAGTEFVPSAMRGKPEAVMACLLYGDSLGLHPSVSLTDIYIVDGRVGVYGALMLAKIREAGHKISFKTLRDDDGKYVGATAIGKRIDANGEVEEEDEWTYTLEDATRAGLYPNSNSKAAWNKTPEVMCRWRACAQLSRFLFPDVFRGGTVYLPDEAEEAADAERRIRNAGAETSGDDGGEIEYGDEPLLAAWLIALFAAANDLEPGVWLPKKVKLALKGKTQEEREALAGEVAAWIEERGGDVPVRPTDDEVIDLSDDAAAVIVDEAEAGGLTVD